MKQVLVTGGAGFIGSHLANFLSDEKEFQIRVLDNLNHPSPYYFEELQKNPKIDFFEGDIRDISVVREAMRGCDFVFHLAAQSNVMRAENDYSYAFESNVDGTFNVLEAAKENGIKTLLFASSREVYGNPVELPVNEASSLNPKNIYGVSKVTGELFCELFAKQFGLDIRIVRLSNVYGPGDSDRVIPLFCKAIKDDQPLTLYGGEQIVDFVWIEDVVKALWQILELPHFEGPINIGSGQGVTIRELAELMSSTAEKEVKLNVLPSRDAEVSKFVADNDLMMEVLGWVPKAELRKHLPKVMKSKY